MRRNVLKGFLHVERMGKVRLVKRVYRASVEGNRGSGTEDGRKCEMIAKKEKWTSYLT